jgi:hypothetical protein
MRAQRGTVLRVSFVITAFMALLTGCGGSGGTVGKDPMSSELAAIDRFSDQAGHLMVRSMSPSLPGSGQAINFDQGAPFITEGLGPTGQKVNYYNFDVQPTAPAPIYVFFGPNDQPVAKQLNVIDAVPGDAGYSDFWQVHKVSVPASYVANSATSLAEITAAGYPVQATDMLVNCPIVPDGSVAALRVGGGSAGLETGWYRDKVVKYFNFQERTLNGTAVPLSPIYVAFNINPEQAGGGPGSGFKTEAGSAQTHNVVATIPSDGSYSPLWSVDVYDNSAFSSVSNLATAMTAPSLGAGVATVNCPIVSIN